MSKSAPQIMLLGKGKGDHTDEMHELINSIQPEKIPADFLDGVYITTFSGKKYQIDPRLYADGLDYRNVEGYLNTLGLKTEDMETVEVMLDLDKTKNILSSNVDEITNKVFEN